MSRRDGREGRWTEDGRDVPRGWLPGRAGRAPGSRGVPSGKPPRGFGRSRFRAGPTRGASSTGRDRKGGWLLGMRRAGELALAASLIVATAGTAVSASQAVGPATVRNCARVSNNPAGQVSYTMHLRRDPCHEYVEARAKFSLVPGAEWCWAYSGPLHRPGTAKITGDNCAGPACSLDNCIVTWWGYRWAVRHGTLGKHGAWHYVKKGQRPV